MKYIILTVLVLSFLLYVFYKPCEIKENYASDSSLIVTPAYKKNIAVVEYNRRANLNIPEINQILSNQIAPINDMYRGKNEKKNVKISTINHTLTNRIPDDMSTIDKYTMPMPNFRDLQGDNHRPKKFINSLK
tara:strand:+ start:1436 stop:1834 length:399 start_codon:yes stop_codon:yes gene_type:complete